MVSLPGLGGGPHVPRRLRKPHQSPQMFAEEQTQHQTDAGSRGVQTQSPPERAHPSWTPVSG